MNFLDTSRTYTYRRFEVPVLRVLQMNSFMNVHAQKLVTNRLAGVQFFKIDNKQFVRFVENGTDKLTFGIAKNNTYSVAGRKIGTYIGEGYHELIPTEVKNEFELKWLTF